MDIDLSKYFDTPERERSHALLMRRPHLEPGCTSVSFCSADSPSAPFRAGVSAGVVSQEECGERASVLSFPGPEAVSDPPAESGCHGEGTPVWTWTENLPPPGPCVWDSEDERQTAEFLKDALVSPLPCARMFSPIRRCACWRSPKSLLFSASRIANGAPLRNIMPSGCRR